METDKNTDGMKKIKCGLYPCSIVLNFSNDNDNYICFLAQGMNALEKMSRLLMNW